MLHSQRHTQSESPRHQNAQQPGSVSETDRDQDTLGNAALTEQLGAAGEGDPRDSSEKQADLDLAFQAGLEVVEAPDALFEEVQPELDDIAEEYGLKWLELRPDMGPRKVLDGKVNPHRLDSVVVLSDPDMVWLYTWVRGLDAVLRPLAIGDEVDELSDDEVLILGDDLSGDDLSGDDLSGDDLSGDDFVEDDFEPTPLEDFTDRFGDFLDHPWLAWLGTAGARFATYCETLRGGDRTATFTLPADPGVEPAVGLRPAIEELEALVVRAPAGGGKKKSSSSSKDGDGEKSGKKKKVLSGPISGKVESSLDGLKDLDRQRQTKRSWTHDERGEIAALLAEMDKLGVLYVDIFGKQDTAYTDDALGRTAIQRVGTVSVPNNRLLSFDTQFEYAGGDSRYLVTLLPDEEGVPELLDAPFAVRRRAAGGGTSAKGRSFRGKQGFFPNPDYWKDKAPDDSVPRPNTRDNLLNPILELKDAGEAKNEGLVAQGAGPGEPWVFCVPDTFDDPKMNPDGRQAGNAGRARRQVDDFDQEASDKAVMRATVYQTRTPPQKRSDAGRDPQKEAGGIAASEWMGAKSDDYPAYSASMGQLGSHEYCHLVGDGDSGECSADNLVVGTSGVNTEQLAMEETLRPYRPRLCRLGYALRLTVTAIVGGTPLKKDDPKDSDWPQDQMASFIRYEMLAHPIDTSLKGTQEIPIHTQVMDGQRGVITEAEVDMLKQTLSGKLDRVLEALDVLSELLDGERTDEEVDKAHYEYSDNGKKMPMSPSDCMKDDFDVRGDKRRAPRDAVLLPGVAAPDPSQDGNAHIGRYTQGSYLGGGTACAGTSVRAAQDLLSGGFDDLNVDETVARGVSDYLTVRSEHPGAPPFLASYEMRTSPANQDLDLDLVTARTIENGDFGLFREYLEREQPVAATITAGAYTFTAAALQDGTLCIFDSHANRIHQRAYKESFASMPKLIAGIKRVITEHGVNLHDDIAVEIYRRDG